MPTPLASTPLASTPLAPTPLASNAASAATFSCAMTVYWEDTDAGGVVYYANYLKFLERARTEWLRSLGLVQSVLQSAHDTLFVVASINVRYVLPARLDDVLRVTVQVVQRGSASMVLEQQVWRAQTLLTTAQVRIGCIRASTMQPMRMPQKITELLS